MKWCELLKTDEGTDGHLHFCAFASDIKGLPNERERPKVEIREWDASSWISSDSPAHDGEMDDHPFTNQELVVLSERVKLAILADAELSRDVQFLPIHVRRSIGEEIPGYSVLNVLPRIEAIKREDCYLVTEKQDIDPATGKPRLAAIGRMVVYARALEGHHIVRLLDYPWNPICSERFAKLWNKHKFTGARTSPIGTVDDPVPDDFKKIIYQPAKII